VENNQMWLVPVGRLPPDKQEQAVALLDEYQVKRDYINHLSPKLDTIADRYSAADITPHFLEATKTPDYSRSRPSFFGKEDYTVWNDGMQQLLGRIQIVKDEERKKLYNPANWIALFVGWILFLPVSVVRSVGVKTGKFWETLSEQSAKVIVYAGLIFIAYHWFGLSKKEVRQAVMRYVGLSPEPEKSAPKESNTPVDKSAPEVSFPTIAPPSPKKP
jgi:hypothetical protein